LYGIAPVGFGYRSQTFQGVGSPVIYEGEVVQTGDSSGPYVMRFIEQSNPSGFQYDVYYPFFTDNAYFWGGYAAHSGRGARLANPKKRGVAVALGDGVQLLWSVR
jgi:hypothetical protein